MKQFLIKYRHTTGTTEDWHREIASFIAALDGDPALKGKIGYRCMKGRDGADYLVVASKGGAPEDPGWYKNIEAQSDIEIQVKGDVLPVRARTASPEEKKRLWPTMVKEWELYDKYQQSTERDIPVVILSPR